MSTPSPDPETVQWVYDTFPRYRLDETIVTDFLRSKWSDYDDFFVEASDDSTPWTLSPDRTQLIDSSW